MNFEEDILLKVPGCGIKNHKPTDFSSIEFFREAILDYSDKFWQAFSALDVKRFIARTTHRLTYC